jgi:hypothetical protein
MVGVSEPDSYYSSIYSISPVGKIFDDIYCPSESVSQILPYQVCAHLILYY